MNYLDKYNSWCNSDGLDKADKEELLAIAENDTEIKERFLYVTHSGSVFAGISIS